MRVLSPAFMNDLLDPDGSLHPILTRVKQDHTLMLSIRKNYINIYYRGGNILRIKEKRQGLYSAFFDSKYNKSGLSYPVLPKIIESQDSSKMWVESFQILKGIMDVYFSENQKPEREFQQLVVRENNFSTAAAQSKYFITDIEFADTELGARFDMLALRFPSSQRKKHSYFQPAFIEMKYSDGALRGRAGILKHLQDIDALISDRTKYETLIEMMETQFKQLDKLGLVNFNRRNNWTETKLNTSDKPEVIFIFANHSPRSSKLLSILNDPMIEKYAVSKKFALKFYVSTFAGYALHRDSMVTLSEFRKLLNKVDINASY